ncbi:MAG: arginine--tRNA ligase [Patescibacteria group bacterium]|nr:arginine--tRNA ligase [Patescibacteria group bacterium]
MTTEILQKHLLEALKKALTSLSFDFSLLKEDLKLEIPPNQEMGDFSISCFGIAKVLKKAPTIVAQELASQLNLNKTKFSVFEQAKNIGPYLNFFINKKIWFKAICEEILSKGNNFGFSNFGKNKKILVEFSAPNTNKPQHLGHLRNNFLGQATANLLAAIGYKSIKINLINDRGIHICKSMLAYKLWGEGKTPESEKIKGDHFVGKYYVLFNTKVKENPELLNEAQKILEQWEKGDSEIIALWQQMNKWALDGFYKTYEKIGINFDKWYFESDTYKLGKKIILKALRKKICYRREDKAIEIDLSKYNLDKKVLIRADGTSVYVTQDVGLAFLKNRDFKPHKSIYVVASEQKYHFQVLFKILELFGFKGVENCYHLSYGLIFVPEGRLKSREGTVVDADDIISEIEQLAKSEIMSSDPNISPIEVSRRAETIALAALKFFLLKFTPEQEVHFQPKESIAFEGATGPYVQYTYTRIQSILEKKPAEEITDKLIDYKILGNPEEVAILKLLAAFPGVIKESAVSYNPTCLATYLLKLSQTFNEFYHKHKVLKAENQRLIKARLVLIQAVAQVLKNGLNLMGINVLERM